MRRPYLIAYLLLLISAAVCQAQPPAVSAADSARLEIVAPKLLTRAFVVSNPSENRRKLIEQLELPEGWRTVAQDNSFTLLPGAQDVRLVAISVPLSALPGPYKVTYMAQDSADATQSAQAQTEVLVLPVFKLEIATRETPRRVIAGQDYTVQFAVTSRCNSPTPVSAVLTGSGGSTFVLSDSVWLANPGECKLLTAVVRTDPRCTAAFTQRLTLKLRISDHEARQRESTAHSFVDVIPRGTPAGDFYHRVPSLIAARFVSEAGRSGFQVEYSGNGSLDSRGATRIGYLLRGPRDLTQHTYGLQDEYYVSVENRIGEARAGDLSFNLSPLMEQNRMGRGARARVSNGPFTAGGYAFRMRPKYADLQESAGFIGFCPSPRLSIYANYLQKSSRALNGQLLGLSSSISPVRGMNLDLDFSADAAASKSVSPQNSALFARFNGGLGGLRLSFERVYAGRDFSGYYHDENHSALSVSFPVAPGMQYHASYRSVAQNLSRDTLRATALREADVQSGISATLPLRIAASLDVEKLTRTDELQRTDLDYDERAATMRLRQSFGVVSLTGSAKRGLWNNHRLSLSGDVERYGLGVTFAPDKRQTYSAGFQTGNSSVGSGGHRSRSLNLASTLCLANRLTFSANFQTTGFDDPAAFQNDQFSAELRCETFRRQAITLRARKVNYGPTGIRDGFSCMAGYEIPIGVPVSRQNDVGCLRGKVFDSEDPKQKGVANIVLILDGLTAISDSRGYYAFPSVKPGVHYLQVDHASMGLHRITTQPVPVELKVRGGKTEMLNIGIERAGSVNGRMTLLSKGGNSARGYLLEADSAASSKAEPTLQVATGLANVEVLLYRDGESFRAASDRDGNFAFTGLRPGRWLLKVTPESLPAFHQPERSNYEVFVQPGNPEDLTVRVIPRTRSLIIVDQGTVPITTSSRK
jgi:hypothetical protein